MFRVVHDIHFSYGHRLLNHPGKCSRLHGHNARVAIEISSEKLDRDEMVIDFYTIREKVGAWIQETLDHRMILSEADPAAALLKQAGEPLVVLKRNPTAETLAKLIFDEARQMRLPVSRVTLWETETSCAEYHE